MPQTVQGVCLRWLTHRSIWLPGSTFYLSTSALTDTLLLFAISIAVAADAAADENNTEMIIIPFVSNRLNTGKWLNSNKTILTPKKIVAPAAVPHTITWIILRSIHSLKMKHHVTFSNSIRIVKRHVKDLWSYYEFNLFLPWSFLNILYGARNSSCYITWRKNLKVLRL